MPSRTTTTGRKRLTREEWLKKGLNFVAEQGGEALRIDRLVSAVGVTTGSFYWHFSGREEFVDAVAGYYDEWANRRVADAVDHHGGDPAGRLRYLMEFVFREDVGRFDAAMRGWAAQEERIAEVVARADGFRLRYVVRLFRALGLGEPEAGIRARLFVGYMCGELVLLHRWGRRKQLATIDDRLAFFLRR